MTDKGMTDQQICAYLREASADGWANLIAGGRLTFSQKYAISKAPERIEALLAEKAKLLEIAQAVADLPWVATPSDGQGYGGWAACPFCGASVTKVDDEDTVIESEPHSRLCAVTKARALLSASASNSRASEQEAEERP